MSQFDTNLKEVFEIIKNDPPRMLKQFLSFNERVNLENHYYHKYTPLMEAVYLDRFDMVQFIAQEVKSRYTKNAIILPQYKKYLNHVSIDGKSALILATISNNLPDIISFLLAEGASDTIRDHKNQDVFYYAKYSTTEEVENFWKNYKK